VTGDGLVAFWVTYPPALEDEVVALLFERGTVGIEHAAPAGGGALLAYFHASPSLEAASLLGRADIQVRRAPVPAVDWVARFRETFRAFDAGRFRVVPAWDAESRVRHPDALLVDPGRAFGTGTHETTRLCLEALGRLADGPGLGRVVDIGTGSGLLAIAALRLGATAAVGVDNDGEAIESAAHHAELNRARLSLVVGDGGRALRAGLFDTVLANLMAPLLLERVREFGTLRSPGGRLVLSGLLLEDVALVSEAYRSLGPIQELRDGQWAALLVG
jgi:ribosomal protein L11 methyltransferase